jgi:DNA-binding CsgD family transcriptional regulator
MDELGEVSGLIEALYDAASGNRSFWPLAPQIARAFGSESCVLQVRGGFAGPVEHVTKTTNFTPEFLDLYQDYYYQHDIWVNKALACPRDAVLGSDDIISDAEFRESLIYQDHCRTIGCFYVLGALLSVGGPNQAFAVFGVHRDEKAGVFPAETKRLGTILLPHLRRALQLRERLGPLDIQRRAMSDALEGLAIGVMVVADTGLVLFSNAVAERLLRSDHGLVIRGNRLHASQPAQDQHLQRTLRAAARASVGRTGQAGGVVPIPRGERKPLGLSVYPFVTETLAAGPVALVCIGDPEMRQAPGSEVLAQIHGLTSAEARLFAALLTGERLQDYATRAGVSFQTAKTHLAHIFDKTGYTRQTELLTDAFRNPVLAMVKG